jgi:prolyl-tRNA synthetase
VFCDHAYLGMEIPPETVDFDDVAGLQGLVDAWTSRYAATEEMHEEAAFAEVPEESRLSARGIEVGHIFYFGTKYSEPMNAKVAGPDGIERPVHMGSYGIGPSRLVAAIIEASHDEAGIVWPDAVAPFDVALINLKVGDAGTDSACAQIQGELEAAGLSVLYDDRDERPGAKFATADLIGLPWQVIVGPKGLAEGKIELKRRAGGERESLATVDLLARIKRV